MRIRAALTPVLTRQRSAQLVPAWENKASVCHVISFLAARDMFRRGFAPVFINCFNRQRVFLLVAQFPPSRGTHSPLPAKSSSESPIRGKLCVVSPGLLQLLRGLSWQRSIVVLLKEQNGNRASSPANCFINLESNNRLLNKALLFCFAIMLFCLPRKALTLKASQGL